MTFLEKFRRKTQESSQLAMPTWLVVGLGNPGERYAHHRHNIGYMVVDELARRMNGTFSSHKSNARICEGRFELGGSRVVLAKANTFMNASGGPVTSLAKYFSAPAPQVIVVHDELDLPFDTIKLKQGGGHGGHNGLRDISAALGSPEYVRVRVGIGRPPGQRDVADFVLSDFSAGEKKSVPLLVAEAADAVEAIVAQGLLAAQQRFHSGQGSES